MPHVERRSAAGRLPHGELHRSTANGTAIGSQSPTEITMVNNSGQDKDTISSLSSNENFSATWVRAS